MLLEWFPRERSEVNRFIRLAPLYTLTAGMSTSSWHPPDAASMTTHDRDQAERLADTLLVMKDGAIHEA
jgi:hypothetical protein